MIYPSETGKGGELLRLRTLERVWIQGKLRMWGRWSYISDGKSGNIFNHYLTTKKVTKTAIQLALRDLKRSGLDETELAVYFSDLMNEKIKSSLAFCTDDEALTIDKVIGVALDSVMIRLLHERYNGKGKSKKQMAKELNKRKPAWCLRTCETRIDAWLNLAEFILYKPMCEAFETNSERFYLHSCAETA